MTDEEITAIVGWPTEPQMSRYRKVAEAAAAAEGENWRKAIDDAVGQLERLASKLDGL